jgi:hypothetical protein
MTKQLFPGKRHAARLSYVIVAGLALVAAGLTGISGAARAGATAPAGVVPGGTISTVAGGVGGPGPARSVAMTPCGLKTAGAWLYIGTGSALRRVNILTGGLTTVAGNNAAGPTGDGGVATATATGACGSAVDPAGNVVIADGLTAVSGGPGGRVRLVAAKTGTFYGQQMTAGHIYTVAGNTANNRIPPPVNGGPGTEGWTGGPTGDGGPAAQAFLGSAADVTFDRAGNMLIADSGLGQICYGCTEVGGMLRVVAARTGTFYGQKMKAGNIYSISGIDAGPAGEGDGGLAAGAWLGPELNSAEVDRSGNIILAGVDEPCGGSTPCFSFTSFVRVIAEVTGTFYGQRMKAGHIYHVAGVGVTGSPPRNAVPGTKSVLWSAGGAVADFARNVVIADGPEVRVVADRSGRFYGQNMHAGYIYRIAGFPTGGYSGDGGPALRALVSAQHIGLDGAGNVVLADASNRVRVIAARTGRFYGQNMTAGHIYTAAGNGTADSGDGGSPLAAEFASPLGISVSTAGDTAFTSIFAVDVIPAKTRTLFGRKMTAGTLYTVAGGGIQAAMFGFQGFSPVTFDASGNLVVAYVNTDKVWLLAATTGTFYGQKMTAGFLYRIAGTGAQGFSGDGGPAVKARLSAPDGAAVDHHGNVLIDDSGNKRVRVLAAATGTFYGKAMKAGDIYTIAGNGTDLYSGDGGPATATGMMPVAVAADAAGNLLLTDVSQRVLVVAAATGTFYGQAMTAGDIYTIAGNGKAGFAGNGGPATSAEFAGVGAVTVDKHGTVLVTDMGNNVVWAIAAQAGTFYGQAMTAGDIYVVAGGGTTILGDGGPATQAQLGGLAGLAVSATGSLLVGDGADHRLRAVSP